MADWMADCTTLASSNSSLVCMNSVVLLSINHSANLNTLAGYIPFLGLLLVGMKVS
jgi:hypothetical protein